MKKKGIQLVLYLSIFLIAVLAILGIAFGVRQAIRAGNLAGIDWYNLEDKEFVITTEKELYDLAKLSDYYDFSGQTIKLGADIVVNEGNAKDWEETAPEKKWQPITEFAGTFDGEGHSISGLYGKSASMSMGLFTDTKKGCVIRDFKLLNSFFTNTTDSGLGSILGEGTGTIEKVYTDTIIRAKARNNGGIAGLIKKDLVLKECWFDGMLIASEKNNGGMIGWVDEKVVVEIDNCLSSAFMDYDYIGSPTLGGFIGCISGIAYRTDVSKVTITNSLATNEIDIKDSAYLGAAIGRNTNNGSLQFENTYAVIRLDDASTEATIGANSGKLVGDTVPRFRQNLIGEGGYQWTNLDFDKYWSCVDGDTPALKYFAKEELNLDGIAKMVDTSWYKKGQKEFVLNDVADLWGLAMLSANTNFEEVTIKLGTDITMNNTDVSTWKENVPEYIWFPMASFSGKFDGQGHTISGIYCYTNAKNVGLFKQVNATASVSDFKLLNSYFRGSYCVGAIAGIGGGNIANIYTNAIVENTGDHTGGFLGAMNQTGTMSNLWFDGIVYGGAGYTGGITSATMSGMCIISHVLNTGTIYGGKNGSTGGLIGLGNIALTLTDSLNAGKVDDTFSNRTDRSGSIVGYIQSGKKADFIGTYATRESYGVSIGTGYPTSGAPFVNTLAELTGNNGYKNTILDFEKYWAIDKDGHPVLKMFVEEVPSLPNVKRPYVANKRWYDDDETVFVINTPEELYGLGQLMANYDFEGKTVKLGKNITLNNGNATTWNQATPQNQWAPINGFKGTFDGQGHTISGLYMKDGIWKIGLFGDVPKGAVIKNVKITNSYLEGAYHIGSIAGMLIEATIDGVYSEAIVVARKGHLGGIAGTVSGGTVNNAWFAGTANSEVSYVGGITSLTSGENPTLSNCLNTGTVHGLKQVGGLIGRAAAKNTTLKYSLNSGKVSGTSSVGSAIGTAVADFHTNVAEGVYTTKESAKKATGGGSTVGLVIVNTAAELIGDGGYQRTILDFTKYWGVVANGTPVLRKFGGSAPSNPNLARAIKPDTSWYDAKKTTFVLNDYADLYGMAVLAGSTDFAGKTIKLGKDIKGNTSLAIGYKENTPLNQWVPIGGFAGTFEGQGKTIEGLSVNNDSAWDVGLFGRTAAGAVIRDFKVLNSYFSGEYYVGSAAGYSETATIQNVYSEAIIDAEIGHAGGIAGALSKSTVENCWFNGSVEAVSYAGGISGFICGKGPSTINHCHNTAPIKGKNQIAGLVGRVAEGLNLSDSLSTGKITGSSQSGAVIGLVLQDMKVNVKATYGTRESASAAVADGKYKGSIALYAEYFLEEYSGYTVTELDYNKYWVAKKGQLPQLKYFAGTNGALNVKNAVRFDTSWYKDNAKTYTLKDKADLYGFAYLVNTGNDFAGKTVRLDADIILNTEDASGYSDTAPKYRWTPIGSTVNNINKTAKFAGTFDGEDKNGKRHYISGLCTDTPDSWFVGLFGATKDADIQNVEIRNSFFAGCYYTGSVVGYASDTDVTTAYSEAIIMNKAVNDSGNTGGIVGALTNGTIDDAWFDGAITTQGQYVGGILGVSFNKCENTFRNCLNTGAITHKRTSGNLYTGGLVGGAQDSFIMSQCVSTGEITLGTGSARVGGVIGYVEKDSIVNNVYTIASAYKEAVGDSAGASLSTQPEIASSLKGYNAYLNTKLDFGLYWSLVEKSVPQLTSFVQGKVIALGDEKLFQPDTTWVTEAEVDSQGNPAGSKENPYIIMDRGDLYGFAILVNGGKTFETEIGQKEYVRLGDSILVNKGDAADWADGEEADYAWTPIGTVGNCHFKGVFDGANPLTDKIQSISGLYFAENMVGGLFVDTDDATLQNFVLENSYFRAAEGSAAVAGWYCGGTFDTIKVAKDVIIEARLLKEGNKNHAAGLVSLINETGTTVNNCWVEGEVVGKRYVGGICSYVGVDGVTFTNCLVTGKITTTGADTGGLLGNANKKITIRDSVVALRSKLDSSSTSNVGAVVGIVGSSSTIEKVYATTSSYDKASGANLNANMQLLEKLTDWFAYKHTRLDFNQTWYVMKDAIPALRSFVTSGYQSIAKAQGWYTNAVADSLGNEPGTKENPYLLGSEVELYDFAKRVNAGNIFEAKHIQLTTDIEVADGSIWTPIGSQTYKFGGIFDGQGHSVSGVYCTAHAENPSGRTGWDLGFFGRVANATIQNVRLLDSFVCGDVYVGGIAGHASASDFRNIYSNATVKATVGSNKYQAGGITSTLSNGEITNCWFDGSVEATGTEGRAGGLLGVAGANVKISSCLNTAPITCLSKRAGGFIGYVEGTGVYLKDSLNAGTVNAGTDASSDLNNVGAMIGQVPGSVYIEQASTHTISSGRKYSIGNGFGSTGKCYSYAGVQITSGQNNYIKYIEIDDMSGAAGYTATGLAFDRPETADIVEGPWVTTDSHPVLKQFAEFFDSAINKDMAGQFRTDIFWINEVLSENEPYIIDRPEELLGFAKLVNEGNTFSEKKVYLGNDIVINTSKATDWANGETEGLYSWTPIGSQTYKFKGIFDGQDYSISGIYCTSHGANPSGRSGWDLGLFGRIENATIQNVQLLNSYMCGDVYIGGIAGHASASDFRNIYSDAIVKATVGSNKYQTGGITSTLANGEITNCWFDGSVETSSSTGRAGGILGVAGANVKISSCLNTAPVICPGKNAGGFIGRVEGAGVYLKDSLNAGTVTTSQTANVGAMIGQVPSGSVYIEPASTHTISSGMQYAIGSGFAGKCYSYAGVEITSGQNNYIGYVEISEMSGVAAYTATGLAFDRPETEDIVEGPWVTTDSHPVLKQFADFFDTEINTNN